MAKPGTTRRRVLGAAAALPSLALSFPVRAKPVEAPPLPADRILWNERLARYRRLAARAQVAAETGWFRAANDRFYRESLERAEDRETAFDRLDRAENLFWRRCIAPLHQAAVALMLTLAPDLDALRTKLAIIRAHQLYEPDDMERDTLVVIDEDLRKLSYVSSPSA
jgi:hypothetical protein